MLAKGPVWGQTSTKWTPRVVQTRLELARCLFVASAGRKRRWMRCTARMGRLRILPSLRKDHTNSKKITRLTHLPPDGYKFYRISPDFTGPLQVTPNTTK